MGWNILSEGTYLVIYWHWAVEVWRTNGIRYPSSPHRQQWVLWDIVLSKIFRMWKQKHSTWGVLSQGRNSKELAARENNGGVLGFNRKRATRSWYIVLWWKPIMQPHVHLLVSVSILHVLTITCILSNWNVWSWWDRALKCETLFCKTSMSSESESVYEAT